MNPRFMRNGLLMLVLVMGVSALLYTWLGASTQVITKPYSGPDSFLEQVEKGLVSRVVQSGETLSVFDNTKPTEATEPSYTVTVANVLTQVQQDIAAAAEKGGKPAADIRSQARPRQLLDRAGPHRIAPAPDHRRLHLLHDAAGPGHQ